MKDIPLLLYLPLHFLLETERQSLLLQNDIEGSKCQRLGHIFLLGHIFKMTLKVQNVKDWVIAIAR